MINAYQNTPPFKIGEVGRGRSGASKVMDVMSHQPESYSKNYGKDDHMEASMIHHSLAMKNVLNQRKELGQHHADMAEWHRQRSI